MKALDNPFKTDLDLTKISKSNLTQIMNLMGKRDYNKLSDDDKNLLCAIQWHLACHLAK